MQIKCLFYGEYNSFQIISKLIFRYNINIVLRFSKSKIRSMIKYLLNLCEYVLRILFWELFIMNSDLFGKKILANLSIETDYKQGWDISWHVSQIFVLPKFECIVLEIRYIFLYLPIYYPVEKFLLQILFHNWMFYTVLWL